jgi:hypothetical protein
MIFSLSFSFVKKNKNKVQDSAQPFFSSGLTLFTPTFETLPFFTINFVPNILLKKMELLQDNFFLDRIR